MPSEKYSWSLPGDMSTNGSTAIDCSEIAMSASWFTPRRSTKRSVSSSTTASESTPMIAKSSLRPVWCVIDSWCSTSLSRLKPSGVNS